MTLGARAAQVVAVVVLALVTVGCSSERGAVAGEPVGSSSDDSVSGVPLPPAPVGDDTNDSCVAEGCEAEAAAERFVGLWWYEDPATLAELAEAAGDLITESMAAELASAGPVVIGKLDPRVHVVVAVESFAVEGGLVVVQLTHRDVGAGELSLTFVDVVNIGGRWRVDGVVTR